MESYKDAHSGKQPTIDTALDLRRKSNYDLNCQRLDAIIDCTILCGKQNIRHSDADSSQSTNKGNFKAILEFRALGDPLLQKHLVESGKNAQYTSAKYKMRLSVYAGHLSEKKSALRLKKWGILHYLR